MSPRDPPLLWTSRPEPSGRPEPIDRSRGALCLFAKPPEPGRVKTRLAATLGPDAAAALAAAFLRDTAAALQLVSRADLILATTDPAAPHPGVPDAVPRWAQGDGDLGARLERVLARALDRAPWAIAVGADSPGAPLALHRAAARALDDGADAVIGHALDGGFYLLGLRRCPPGLFADLPWSAPDTGAAMAARLAERGLTCAVIDPWFDVDAEADLARLAAHVRAGRLAAPATAPLLADVPAAEAGAISVIVPALDEAARIGAQVAALLAEPGFAEVLVADGGSADATAARARAAGAGVVVAPRGRAAQMNAAARLAVGDVLLFVHADVALPPGAATHVRAGLADGRAVGGAFRTWTMFDGAEGDAWPRPLRPLVHLADVRSRLTRLPYGDQAPFVRREVFEEVGGYPDQPLMEDLELSLRLRRLGAIGRAPASVRVSARRLAARPFFTTLVWNVFPALYRLGVPPEALARLYAHIR